MEHIIDSLSTSITHLLKDEGIYNRWDRTNIDYLETRIRDTIEVTFLKINRLRQELAVSESYYLGEDLRNHPY